MNITQNDRVCLKTIFRTGRVLGIRPSRRPTLNGSPFYYYMIVWDDMPTEVFDFSEIEAHRDLLFFPEHATLNQMKCIFTLQKNDN